MNIFMAFMRAIRDLVIKMMPTGQNVVYNYVYRSMILNDMENN